MAEEEKKEENVVYVGKKGLMNYVLAVMTQFSEGKKNEVVIKARGKAISKAVDVAEIVRQRFLPDVKPKSISIDTEEMQGSEGLVKVSAIEIVLTRKS